MKTTGNEFNSHFTSSYFANLGTLFLRAPTTFVRIQVFQVTLGQIPPALLGCYIRDMSALRPGTASRLKTAQNQGILRGPGTATRLTTGQRPGTRGGGGGATLNTSVHVEDRPITQQGLSGLKTADRGTRRQFEDKSYYLGLLRSKINELTSEIGVLTRQIKEIEDENASFIQYEQMAEKLALEIKELQGELGDYNTLVDKATLGEDISNVEMDWEELKAANERAEKSLESLFEEKQQMEMTLKSLEQELKLEQQKSESLIQEMGSEERGNYLRLRDLNDHLMAQLTEGQARLEQLTARRIELEQEISTSQVKQEAMRLYAQLREAEAKRDQLLAEEAAKDSPERERERLLLQVREDNQEIANIECQTRETKEKIAHKEEELQLLEQELDENRSERHQKYRELKKREQQIDEFLNTFDETKALEQSNISELQATIVELLESTSRHLMNASQTSQSVVAALKSGGSDAENPVDHLREQLNFKTSEVSKSKETEAALKKECNNLSQDIIKVEQLEAKVTQEMESLREQIAKMEAEIQVFDDLDRVKEDAKFRREALTKEKERVDSHRQSLHQMNQQLAKDYANLQATLANDETYVQLSNLERRWAQHEQTNFGLMESIANKRAETDHTEWASKAMELVRSHNESLKAALASKPMAL